MYGLDFSSIYDKVMSYLLRIHDFCMLESEWMLMVNFEVGYGVMIYVGKVC
jgi:hypothetical protein